MKPQSAIKSIHAREVLDSRGWPTVEADVGLESGAVVSAMVPSGASTGKSEALELRDGDAGRFAGRGVLKAVANVEREIAPALAGLDAAEQEMIDARLISLDGTTDKSRLGANAILGVSCACARAGAVARGVPLYRHLAEMGGGSPPVQVSLPLPMTNIISGGLHAEGAIDFQDFLVICAGAKSYRQCLEWTSAIWLKTREALARRGFAHLGVADEGGFGAPLPSNREALKVLQEAVRECGLAPGRDIFYALDAASSHFHDSNANTYHLHSEGRNLAAEELIQYIEDLVSEFPILSIEDPLHEEGWADWPALTARLGSKVQIVGDDLFTTNPNRLARGLELGAANSVLVKINQIGTLTEAHRVLKQAQAAGYSTVLSARSGETEDAFMSDLAVGWNAGQIKIGSLTRSSRLAKYNQLIRLAEALERDGMPGWVGKAPLDRWLKGRMA
ncbi:phosphopyruvate hydratase [Candidatus Sumerlaeota bacterium]|nr:phosphopyruvate hydratase [Candidatus Sumerlaeota bacterium]